MAKILIIDDDPSIRKAYVVLCKKQKWDYETAENGLVGLEKLKDGKYDIILLDVLMPKMTGIDFLKAVKKEGLELPTTIVMTNSQVPENTGELAVSLGADEYMVKASTRLAFLVSKVNMYLSK